MTPTGWQCPQCRRVWAPYVNECGACAPAVVPETLDPPRTPYAPAWRYPYCGGSVIGPIVPWWDLLPYSECGSDVTSRDSALGVEL